ncbi:DNA polymerase epsilon subunit 1 [Wickerhamomyces ciferrii]|uniref:DNA polymerase epsilon catalytic subunit n=1 Tax=Wickerhamomyces ciferrii (strain ATCC 14091 / BCRC 22168 / CBS 111 / JCM 3599 / NBRC 0793 / NRRL Y-1031 F-60-10) TaxID=1206466 RepID=K0KG22_WICCF|nr:DNA polymerase epsilon subunit 1 [Wickerhamomyces ciferrii]CCH44105.1 DNA polymerase epsilon subunit 1 [Wickerhamomyces ciferrii]
MGAPANGKYKGSTTARYVKSSINPRDDYVPNGGPAAFQAQRAETKSKLDQVKKIDQIDTMMGFERFDSGPSKTGWLCNMHATTIPSKDYIAGVSGVDYYFLDEEGGTFKATIQYDPYFLVVCTPGSEAEVEELLKKKLEQYLKSVAKIEKDDLAIPNHLIGIKSSLLRLNFPSSSDMFEAKKIIQPIVKENQTKKDTKDLYSAVNNNYTDAFSLQNKVESHVDATDYIEDIREHDVPYCTRVSIDKNLRVGKWYKVSADQGDVETEEIPDRIDFGDAVILAFDIEATKRPLKFPDSSIDQVMMISYMIDGDGFLITNREIISEDIDDFEYTPKAEYPGLFTVFNEPDEKATLERFFEHIREAKPTIIATFNGDFFDWPFIEARANVHDLDMFDEIGFAIDGEGEYKSTYCAHMDCFRWVKRDSYLPQGSQGLKAVTTSKLGYNPIELDPELMTPYAYSKPQLLSEYSVSDAVATYYLYKKIISNFIISLGIIVPLNPDELLRKGTGTLCEMLLMVQAYENDILLPNKHVDPLERFYDGHLLESETYVGGHVESLEAGVFRSDLESEFKIDPTAIDELIADLDNALKFSIVVESKVKLEDVENYDEVYNDVKSQLLALRENPKRSEKPLIYHVDVASMYPNIMCSNRLQPDSMKTEKDCAACDFNRPGKTCDRRMTWAWRGEYYPPKMDEYGMVKRSLQNETFPPKKPYQPRRTFEDLSYQEQVAQIKKRLQDYSRKNYHKVKQSETVERESIICQRENPFYVDTVRSFRDRRYEFKGLAKVYKKKSDTKDRTAKEEAEKRVVYYDSLQLAFKVILNSFYGYVMRKGSRWYSIEMAGITCLTGATIIQMARGLIERLGRPLELDTDGIWCILPKSFPEDFTFNLKNGKKAFCSYPCSMLNYLVHEQFTNHQYQTLVDPVTKKYETHSDNSIFFEVDGPYKAMVLPTSKEEGKGLKKRYAVFNDDGSLAELKGFELKRRGELQLIKNFQSDIFKLFLEGDTLEGCYGAVANVANRWLDVLDTKGRMLEDEDLIELICENKSMSKSLEEYEGQKSTSITTARRLGEFLGAEMVKDKGLQVKYIISERPINAPVTERAIPVAIFSSDITVKRNFLRRWLLDPSLDDFDARNIIDWNYYKERLESVIQKIITIPAALQDIENPVSRVAHPDWLQKRIATSKDKKKQSSLSTFFTKTKSNPIDIMKDIEDIGKENELSGKKPLVGKVTSKKRKNHHTESSEPSEEDTNLLNGPCPAPDEDYVGFLAYQKVKWKVQKKSRERRKALFGESSESSYRSTVGNMVRNQAENFAGSTWQVLQYKLDSNPGDIKAFVLIDGKIQSFIFHIPRKLYMSFRSSVLPDGTIPSCEVEKVNSILPNGHKASNLFKLTMPETVYQDELSKAGSVLQNPNVLGIYEAQVEPTERAIMELGNSVNFNSSKIGSLGKGLKNGFDLKSLSMTDTTHYLQKFTMPTAYLFHMVTNNYQIYSLFKSWDKKVMLFVLKPSRNAQPISGNLEKIYRDLYEAKREKIAPLYGIIDYQEELEFETVYFEELPKLHRKLNSFINKINEESPTKPLFVLQSPTANNLSKSFKTLSDFPVIHMNVGEINVPAIGWQGIVLKRVCNHYLALASWIKHLLALAKYGNIPLCNLRADNIGYLIDIEYARRLKKSDIVLWWSPRPTPDYGGLEKDSILMDNENYEFPIINNPEIYETVALEVDVSNLTINTVLTSALINEAEGTDLAEVELIHDENSGTSTFAEDSFSGPGLSVLRTMVKDWWDDAVKDNANADSMVHTFVSWVQDSQSYLYDSSLKYHVHNLTKKALLQLVGEFSKLGSSVIFANRSKIILRTSKVSVETSYAYAQYVVKAVRSRPLFNYLDLQIDKYWDLLIWMDEHNFGGRACLEISEKEEQDLIGLSKWQIKQYLPSIIQPEFEDWVIIFLDALIKDKNKMANVLSTPRVTQINHILKKNQGTKTQDEDIQNGLFESFRKPLLKRVKQLLRNQTEAILDTDLINEYEFPRLPGSSTVLKNPVLELVKFLCAIFSLSKKRNLSVRLLRKELLNIFEIREFAKESVFYNPSKSLKVPGILCEYCHHIRDLDFCRDEAKHLWKCEKCDHNYNKALIEERLINTLEKTITNFFVQDLKCEKCNRVKESNMSDYCSCSGQFVESQTKQDVSSSVETFDRISAFYDLRLLKDFIDQVF